MPCVDFNVLIAAAILLQIVTICFSKFWWQLNLLSSAVQKFLHGGGELITRPTLGVQLALQPNLDAPSGRLPHVLGTDGSSLNYQRIANKAWLANDPSADKISGCGDIHISKHHIIRCKQVVRRFDCP